MKSINKFLLATIIAAPVFLTSCTEESISGDKISLSEIEKQYKSENSALESFQKGIMFDTIGTPIKDSNNIPTTRDDLGKMRVVVKIYNGNDNAGISVPGFGGVKLGKEESNLNVYYIETKTVNNNKDSIVYGCGYSLHYLFKKVERGISIDNIPSIAASAQLNSKKTQVFYSLQTYGMSGINLVKYFKPTVNKNFNVEGFGIMQSSIDGIHNIMGDSALSSTIKFQPEILKFVRPYELEQLN